MATSQNRRNTKEGSDQGTTKKNYTGQRFGNDHGEIRFGQIDKQARVTAGCQMNAKEGTHTFSMDNDGEREGCTTSICPQRLQMDCGRDSKKEEDSMVFYADNGNIVINAGNGLADHSTSMIRITKTQPITEMHGEAFPQICLAKPCLTLHKIDKHRLQLIFVDLRGKQRDSMGHGAIL